MIRNIKRALAIFLALLLAAPSVALADEAASALPSENIDAQVETLDGLELDAADDAYDAPPAVSDDAAGIAFGDPVTPPYRNI